MRYKTLKALAAAAAKKQFTGVVMVDNDQVLAYQDEQLVYDFAGLGPRQALHAALAVLGIAAEPV